MSSNPTPKKIYRVEIGALSVTRLAASPEEAIASAEAEVNAPIWVGERRAIARVAEDDWFTRDGGYLIHARQARAKSVREMREIYMGGGYCLVPAEG